MENINKSQLSAGLKKALADEHLWTKDAARLLNLNPIYISFMLNPKSFDKCGSTAWKRLNDWFVTNEPLSSFKFPASEAVWGPKKQEANVEGTGVETVAAIKKEKKVKEKKEKKHVDQKHEDHPQPEKQDDSGKIIEAAADMLWGKIQGKLQEELNKIRALTPINELTVPEVTRQSFALDIEINLVLNGQRLKIA